MQPINFDIEILNDYSFPEVVHECVNTAALYKGIREDIKKNCRFGENGTIGGEGVRKIIEFSSFTNDEKHGRGRGSQSNISLLHRTQL